jgi:outer membrane protein assembly factor BamB
VVIELGYEREVSGGRLRDAWRSLRGVRPFAQVLCAGLLLAVAGSAPAQAAALTEVASHPLAEDADFAVLGDRLFVAAASEDGGRPTLTAYELPGGRMLWRAPYESSVEQFVDVQRGDGIVLVTGLLQGERYATPTTVLDAATGQVKWTTPLRLAVADDGRTGFVGGATVRAFDLATGRDLWSAAFPADAAVRSVGSGRALVLTGAGEGQLRDGRTGAILRSGPMLPAGVTPNLSTATDGAIMIGYQDATGGRRVVGYAADTLERRWERTLSDDDAPRFGACGRLVCTARPGGVVAVDPATGVQRWDVPGADTVFETGGIVVAARWPDRLAAIDPASGRTLVELDGWDTALNARGDVPLVGVAHKKEAKARQSWLVLIEPHGSAPRHLGPVPDRVWDCVAGTASVVCRAPGGRARVWTYQK